MTKMITLDNYATASNKELFALLNRKGSSARPPAMANEAITRKVDECEMYLNKKTSDGTYLWQEEYERFADCGFNEYDSSMMYKDYNFNVLRILHQHSFNPDSPTVFNISEIYQKELEEDYRDSLIAEAIEVLKKDIPFDKHDRLDLITIHEAIRELDQYIGRFSELLTALEYNDEEINKILGLANKEKPKKHFKDYDDELTAAMKEVNKKYAAIVLAQNPKFMSLLYKQFHQQQAMLERLGVTTNGPPAPPRKTISGLSLKKHMRHLNRMLHTGNKVTLHEEQINRHIERVLKSRTGIMQEHIRNIRKHAKPVRMQHLYSDLQQKGQDILAEIDDKLLELLEQVNQTTQATQEMIDAVGSSASAKMQTCQKQCNVVREHAQDLHADLKDIHSECYKNPVVAVWKIFALVENLRQIYRDICDAVAEKTVRVSNAFYAAKDTVAGYLEPLGKIVDGLSEYIPSNIKRMNHATAANELRTTKRRTKERKY